MSSDLTSLHVDITADGSSAQDELDQLNARLAALETAFKASSSAADQGSASIEKVGVVSKDASSGLEAMASHAGTVGRAFSAMGFEAEGAAARIEGMVGVFREMSAAVPELLAIGAALVAVSSAFDFVKEAISSAAEFQSQMETLRAAVEAQGGSWDTLRGKIEDFVQTESLASGFTENELVAAMNQLVTAGTSVSDAMTLVSVAEETAVAHHKSVLEVTQMLIEAEAGRGTTLAQLDPKIRSLISAHAELSQVLDVLHQDNEKQIEDSDSMERATRLNKAAWEEFSKTLGDVFLPMATAVENAITGIILQLERLFKGLSEMGQHLIHGWSGFTQGWNDFVHGLNDNAMDTVAQTEQRAQNAHNDRFKGGIHLEKNPILGLGRGNKGSGAGYSPQDLQAMAVDETALAAAHIALAKSGESVVAAHAAMKAAIDPAMDSEKQNTLAVEKLQEAYAAAKDDIGKQVQAVEDESKAERSARTEVEAKHKAYQDSVAALNHLEQSLAGKTKLTAAEKNEVNAAKDAVKEHERAYKDADTTLKSLGKSIDAHQKALDSDTKAIKAFNDEQQKMLIGLNDAKEKEDQKVVDDKATYGKSLQQQIDYYRQKYDNAVQADAEFFALHHAHNQDLVDDEKNFYTKLNDLQLQAWKTSQDDAKKAQQQEETDVQNFLDDIIVKHKSFKDMFKSIWDDILKIFIEDVAKMIAESSLFKSVFANIGGASSGFLSLLGTGGGGAAEGAPPIMGTGMNWFGLTGAPGSSAASAFHVNIAGSSPGVNLGGSSISNVMAPLTVLAMTAGIGGAIGSMEGGNLPGMSAHTTNGMLGGIIGGIGGGVAASLMGVGAAGWVTGGLAAALPALLPFILGGALLGGGIGGLIGPHTNPHDSPDLYNTSQYGQAMADMGGSGFNGLGAYTANGQQFTMNAQLNQNLGGKGEIAYIANFLKTATPDQLKAAGLTSQEIQYFSGANGNEYYQKNGMVNLGGNNQSAYWSDLAQAAQDATQKIQALGTAANGTTNALTPIYNVTHSFPDWQNPQVALGGNYTPGGPSTSGATRNGTAPVHVTINTTGVVGMTADDIVNHVAKGVADHLNRSQLHSQQVQY